ncbi:hypothetical protein GCU56_21135 [Geodermatophilus sabuli]|uniref:Uncharacterized protein n=1 Tax=Geodermatophilus sabuli TaxID=1564158 RepID=A0A7K3W668_9ACTN|nr:hypothetical protein [Geodermatophilus sabuli]NEK60365.1 hypothetical protein [Geodermatophilus sabuli]
MSDAPDWVEEARRLVAGLGATLGESLQQARRSAAADGDHPADCRWCPLCQAAAVVRGERPEVTTALADLLTAAAEALRTLAEPVPTQPAPDAEPEPAPGPPPVQRIEIA